MTKVLRFDSLVELLRLQQCRPRPGVAGSSFYGGLYIYIRIILDIASGIHGGGRGRCDCDDTLRVAARVPLSAGITSLLQRPTRRIRTLGAATAVRIGGSSRNETAIAERRRRLHGGWTHGGAASSSAAGQAPVRAANDERPDQIKYAGLPTAWDWRNVNGVNYVPPARTQGSCGACYVIATVGMLESRLAIASGGRERPTLSVQEILSCSAYSQGCLGGFPYLVGKYLTDVGVVSEQCFPTTDATTALFHPDVDVPPAVNLPRAPSAARRPVADGMPRTTATSADGTAAARGRNDARDLQAWPGGGGLRGERRTVHSPRRRDLLICSCYGRYDRASVIGGAAVSAATAATMTMVEEALPLDLLGGDRSGRQRRRQRKRQRKQ